jgi:DNA-binding MarR family transcriptional regulator
MVKFSVIPLITRWEEFTESTNTNGLEAFAEWLLTQETILKTEKLNKVALASNDEEYLAANYISRLNKYVKAYVKPLFFDNHLGNSDEFSILSLISRMDRPTKQEVCKANIVEPSTGIEMIRRLIKANYIMEEVHEKDGRAKRLTLTNEGKEVLITVYKRLGTLKQKVLGNLSKEEKIELLRMLAHLDKFHERITTNML